MLVPGKGKTALDLCRRRQGIGRERSGAGLIPIHARPQRHPSADRAQVTKWHFGCYGNTFDPASFDERTAKLRIGDIAKRRAAGKAAFARRKPA